MGWVLSIGLLLSLASGCGFGNPTTETPEVAPMPTNSPEAIAPPEEPPASPAITAEQLLSDATAQAAQASALAQSAQSRDDWALVANLWEQAIALIDQIPESAPEHAAAQQAKATYTTNLTTAQQAADLPVDTTPRLHTPLTPSEETEEEDPADTAEEDSTETEEENSAETEETTDEPADPDADSDAETAPDEDPDTETDEPAAQSNGSAEVALANHLTQSGAHLFAAYWCIYCERQQDMFGAAGAQQLEVIECDPRGDNPQVARCRAANVSGFPTWHINGQQYSGLQSLNRLADLSGYNGPRDFGN
ncbi:MAG: hypothetical protein AAFX78_05405 [Cyanobacteria bacterium J06638_20]